MRKSEAAHAAKSATVNLRVCIQQHPLGSAIPTQQSRIVFDDRLTGNQLVKKYPHSVRIGIELSHVVADVLVSVVAVTEQLQFGEVCPDDRSFRPRNVQTDRSRMKVIGEVIQRIFVNGRFACQHIGKLL